MSAGCIRITGPKLFATGFHATTGTGPEADLRGYGGKIWTGFSDTDRIYSGIQYKLFKILMDLVQN